MANPLASSRILRDLRIPNPRRLHNFRPYRRYVEVWCKKVDDQLNRVVGLGPVFIIGRLADFDDCQSGTTHIKVVGEGTQEDETICVMPTLIAVCSPLSCPGHEISLLQC